MEKVWVILDGSVDNDGSNIYGIFKNKAQAEAELEAFMRTEDGEYAEMFEKELW